MRLLAPHLYKINMSAKYCMKKKRSHEKTTLITGCKILGTVLFTGCFSSGLTHAIISLTHSFLIRTSRLANENHTGAVSANLQINTCICNS